MKKIILLLFCSAFAFAQKDLALAEKFQSELNKSYADSLKSPLTKEDLKQFKGLDFYPINQKYIVEAVFIRTKREKSFKMKTTTSRTPMYKKYGELHFSIDGKELKLNVPFREILGSLLHLSRFTRPDISLIVGVLSRFAENPATEDWECAKRVFRYLKGTKNEELVYQRGLRTNFIEIYVEEIFE